MHHNEFINKPILSILSEAANATSSIGTGINTFPLQDYLMQSILISAAGFQEQKFGVLMWELASIDLEYRYDYIKSRIGEFGTFSSYRAKRGAYRDLCDAIERLGVWDSFIPSVESDDFKRSILSSAIDGIIDCFGGTPFAVWSRRDFESFKADAAKTFICSQILNFPNGVKKVNLLENKLQEIYENFYNQRNRIAHNTFSKQQNLPKLSVLREQSDVSQNYFVWFCLLVLIDLIIMEFYSRYREGLKVAIW